MGKALQVKKSANQFHERLDAMPKGDLERMHAKARLARAEFNAQLIARAVRVLRNLVRMRILRPIKRAFGTANP